MLKRDLQKRLKGIQAKVLSLNEVIRFSFSMYGFDPEEFEDCNNLQIEFGPGKTKVDIALDMPIDTNADWYYYLMLTLKGFDEVRELMSIVHDYNEELK